MTQVSLQELINKLNSTGRRSLEGAAGLCLSRTNYNVEVEHWLMKLLEQPNTDLAAILQHFGVDVSRLIADLTRCLDRFKTGNSRPPALSPDLVALTQSAWLIGSVDFGAGSVRTGHLICALLADESLRHVAKAASSQLDKISLEQLRAGLPAITRATDESSEPAAVPSSASSSQPWTFPSTPVNR